MFSALGSDSRTQSQISPALPLFACVLSKFLKN